MVGIGYLITTHRLHGIIQGSLTHFGTQGTGVAFLPVLKYDLCDIRVNNMIRYFKRLTQLVYPVQFQIVKAQINRDSTKLKRMRIETPQSLQGIEQRKTVLSTGNTDCDFITGLYHMIIVNSLTGKTVYLL